MKLENKEMDTVVVDNLFRRIHSIKGSVGAVPDSMLLSRLSHEFESSFDYIRKGIFIPNEGTVNLFLTSVDACKKLLNCVKNREVPTETISTDVTVVIDKLKHLNHLAETNQEIVSDESYNEAKTSGALSIAVAGENDEPGILVQNEKLDALLKLSGEMTMVRNYFQILSRDAELQAKPEILYKKSEEMLRGFNKITDSLQKQIMELRQVNLETVFSKLPRTVRTTAQELGKKVQIKFSGGEIGIDKNIAKDLNSALIHMIRNSIDHGIENSQKRSSLSKTLDGNIQVDAIATPGVIKIVISDDGAGLDRIKIEKKAISNRLVTEENARKMSDQEIYQFIFHAGFSTMEQVSNISGRGVGMDVVKNAMINHHGRIQVDSVLGQSTTFTMFLPIVKSVLVESTVMAKDNGLIMGVPQAEISYITVAKDLIRSVLGTSRTVQFDNRTIPMFSFKEIMSGKILLSDDEISKKSVIVMQHKDQQLALLVDAIDGQFDAVILPFDKLVKTLPGFKGTTLLGSDGVAYIVSVQQMISLLNPNKLNLEVAV
jgi:two-component system chemotaxis sensor kinase CheA